ncbi:MAG TPA: GAF domain-containing protein, partial [Polyangiaceae bacterium]|nr:GAF domain-containing protein [Polyangiaceae bacterium]
MKAPLPANEADRLRALSRYRILDTPNEAAFDRVAQLAARLFDVPMALVTLIDENRQWWKSCVGVEGTGTDRDSAFCAYAILSSDPLIVEDATSDLRFADNPFVTGEPYVRFYAGAPLVTSDGFQLGSLCILDTEPRQMGREQITTLVDLSRIVVDELELRLSNQALRAAEERIQHSEELLAQRVSVLEAILETAGEGIVVLDENAQFMVYNPAARRIVGQAPAIGDRAIWPMAYSVHLPESGDLCPAEELPLRRALRGECSNNVELLIRSAGRADRLVRVNGRPLRDAQGQTRGG